MNCGKFTKGEKTPFGAGTDIDPVEREVKAISEKRRKNLEKMMQNKHPEILAYIKEYCRMK